MQQQMKRLLKEILPPKIYYFLKRKMVAQFDERYIIYDFLNYKNGVMLDVGSMDGSSFMPFLLRGWEIFAFEPDKDNHLSISAYLEKWNLNANLFDKAVSNTEEEKTFYTSNTSTGIPSLLKFDENQVVSHKVSTIKLEKLVSEKQIEKVDFLKIDVEGYDLMALQGFDFNQVKPRVIMVEFEDKKTALLGYSTSEMANFLLDRGYHLIYSIWNPIEEYGVQHTWKKWSVDQSDIEADDWGNIVAFSELSDYEQFRRKHKI